MTSTMAGELARLFGIESRERTRQAVGASMIERTAHLASAHRLQQISNEFRNRQIASGLLDSVIPLQGVIQNAATSLGDTLNAGSTDTPMPTNPIGDAGSAIQDLGQRANDAIGVANANAQGAGQQAQQAGSQAAQTGSTLSTVILASAVGFGLFLLFTRK